MMVKSYESMLQIFQLFIPFGTLLINFINCFKSSLLVEEIMKKIVSIIGSPREKSMTFQVVDKIISDIK